MISPKTKWRSLLALVLGLALVAAACGDDDDDAVDTETTVAEDGATTTVAEEGTETTVAADDGGAAGVDPAAAGDVFVSGSSTVEPISVRVAELLADVAPDVNVTVEGPGTGDGFVKFCAGEADIADASRAIKDEEAQACADAGIEFIELAVAYDGIAVMTSPDNADVTCLTTADLYALIGPESEGFGNWSDAQDLAAALGSATVFPDASLDLTGPGPESGTYDAFVELALGDPADVQLEAGAITEDQAGVTRPDYASSADDNVIIQNIEGSSSSLGWVGFAFAAAEGDNVKVLEVDAGDGCVASSIDTIADGSYPLSRTLYIYVNAGAAAENPAVHAYVDYYLSAGLIAVSEVGYVDLDDATLQASIDAWASM